MAFIEDVVIVSAVLYEMIRRDVHKVLRRFAWAAAMRWAWR